MSCPTNFRDEKSIKWLMEVLILAPFFSRNSLHLTSSFPMVKYANTHHVQILIGKIDFLFVKIERVMGQV